MNRVLTVLPFLVLVSASVAAPTKTSQTAGPTVTPVQTVKPPQCPLSFESRLSSPVAVKGTATLPIVGDVDYDVKGHFDIHVEADGGVNNFYTVQSKDLSATTFAARRLTSTFIEGMTFKMVGLPVEKHDEFYRRNPAWAPYRCVVIPIVRMTMLANDQEIEREFDPAVPILMTPRADASFYVALPKKLELPKIRIKVVKAVFSSFEGRQAEGRAVISTEALSGRYLIRVEFFGFPPPSLDDPLYAPFQRMVFEIDPINKDFSRVGAVFPISQQSGLDIVLERNSGAPK